jgi:hypothetical protein
LNWANQNSAFQLKQLEPHPHHHHHHQSTTFFFVKVEQAFHKVEGILNHSLSGEDLANQNYS